MLAFGNTLRRIVALNELGLKNKVLSIALLISPETENHNRRAIIDTPIFFINDTVFNNNIVI